MVARARVLVDAVLHAHVSFAALHLFGNNRPQLALTLELAFAFGDDHLEAFFARGHRFLQYLGYVPDPVVIYRLQPAHADALERPLHAHVRGLALAVLRRRRQLLRPRGRAVAVLHDHEDAVVFVEHRVGDAGRQAVMPEAAVAHHGYRALAEHGMHSGVGGETESVAEHRVADIEGRQRGEEMAADVR